MTIQLNIQCPVCAGQSSMLDVVDLNKACLKVDGKALPLSGHPIYYYQCSDCQFCFAPEMYTWTLEMFEQYVYNDEYIKVDPAYEETRPKDNVRNINHIFQSVSKSIRHLDYGGGNGTLS